MNYNFDPELADIVAMLPENDFSDPVKARKKGSSLPLTLAPYSYDQTSK